MPSPSQFDRYEAKLLSVKSGEGLGVVDVDVSRLLHIGLDHGPQ